MRFLLDSADVAELRWAAGTGLVDGVTTDPVLVSRAAAGREPRDVVRELCAASPGTVAVGVIAVDAEGMYREGKDLARLAENVVVRVPVLEEGLIAARRLASEGIAVDVTLICSAMQGLAAAQAGARSVSVAVGMLDDAGQDGTEVVGQLRDIFDRHDLETALHAAALRHPADALRAALAGADAASLPAPVLRDALLHPLTDRGVDRYLGEWSRLRHRADPEGGS